MKKYLLPALLWALASSLIFAQKSLSPAFQAYADQLPPQTTIVLQKAELAGNLPMANLPFPSPGMARHLDSTRCFFGYSLKESSDSTPVLRSTYAYQHPGNVVETLALYDQGHWTPVSRFSMLSDALGRTLEVLAETFDETSARFYPDTRLLRYPHGTSGLLFDSVVVLGWNRVLADWQPQLKIRHCFNPQDQLTQAYHLLQADGQNLQFLDQFSYDCYQNNTSIESFQVSDVGLLPVGQQTFQYSKQQLLEAMRFVPDGLGGYTPFMQITCAYLPQQLPAEIRTADWQPDLQDWTPVQSLYFSYDSKKRLISQEKVVFGPAGQDTRALETYAYGKNGYLSRITDHHWVPEHHSYGPDARKFYYDAPESAALTSAINVQQTLRLSPNPCTDELHIGLDHEARVEVFDAYGECRKTQVLHPGEPMFLQALPAGFYLVVVHLESGIQTGTIIKQ